MLDLDQVTIGDTYIDDRMGTRFVVREIRSLDTDPDGKEVLIEVVGDESGGVWRDMRHFRSKCRLLTTT